MSETIGRYQLCKYCVMDTSDSEIKFNSSGECNHCLDARSVLSTRWLRGTDGQNVLAKCSKLISEAGRGHRYDCAVGISGGIDSSYLLHITKTVMGLRPLAIHVDAGWNSEISVQNIEHLVKSLEVDLITYVVDWEEMRDLQLAFLRASVANQDIPQDHAFSAKLFECAIDSGIKFVLSGTNFATESILPRSWGYDPNDLVHLNAIHRQFGTMRLKSFPRAGMFRRLVYWPLFKGVRKVAPLDYVPYDRAQAIEALKSSYGWHDYGGKHHESRWTKFFQSYYLPKKFGYDKRRAHLSSLIVAGQIDRESALRELSKNPYLQDDIESEKIFVARKLGIAIGELDNLIALPNKTFEDYPNDASVRLALLKLRAHAPWNQASNDMK